MSMASFRTHYASGLLLGAVAAIGMPLFGFVPIDWKILVPLAICSVVGAIMPDIDSDTSVPFHATFGALALFAAAVAVSYVFLMEPGVLWKYAAYPALAVIFVYGGIGALFRRFTRHRGIVHSIPAALIAGLLVFSFALRLHSEPRHAFFFGAAISVGYLTHLILDELYAAVNFHGIPFVPSKSLGSALKLVSTHRKSTLAIYIVLAALILANQELLLAVSQEVLR